ncbi:MAG: hypothetical protein RIS64_4554, partial [Bacteroidota bacterium]
TGGMNIRHGNVLEPHELQARPYGT